MFNNWMFFNELAFYRDPETRKAKLTRIFLHEACGYGFFLFFIFFFYNF